MFTRGGTPAPWADADLDPINAALQQKASAIGGRDVAGHELDVAEPLAKLFDCVRHDAGVAVRDVDDDDIDLGSQQFRRPFKIVALCADRRTDPQPALSVSRGKGQLALHDEILGGDQSSQGAVGIQERKLLDLVRPQRRLGLRGVRFTDMRHQPVAWRHPRRDRATLVRKPQVARRQ